MNELAFDLGFDSVADLLGRSEIVYAHRDLNWYLTNIRDNKWAAWTSLDILTKTFKYFSSYDEAKEYFKNLYYSLYGYPLHLAQVGHTVNLKCEHCNSNMTLLFVQEEANLAWLSCPHISNQIELHESLAVPLTMTGYLAS
jgi:hypothetical protein